MDRASSRLFVAPVVVVVLVTCARVLAFGRTFGSDTYHGQVVPALAYIGDRIGALQLPEWWDGVGLGVPFAANPDHPVFYPPAWLMGLLPDVAGADLLAVLHLAWLGIGVALLSRRLGAREAHAIVAGGAATVSGVATWAVAHGAIFPLAWSPWVVLAAARVGAATDRGAAARAAAWLSAAMGVMLVAGPLGYAPSTAVLALAVAAAAADPSRRWPTILAATLGLLGGALVGAVALVPVFQLELAPSPLATAPGVETLLHVAVPLGSGAYLGLPLLLLAGVAMVRRSLLPLAMLALAGAALGALRARGHLAPSLLVLASLAGVGLSELSAWLSARPRLNDLAVPLVGALLVGHMIPLSWRELPRVERAELHRVPFLVAKAVARPDGDDLVRIARPFLTGHDDRRPGDALGFAHRTAQPNRGTRFGGAYALGHDRAITSRLRAAWLAAALGSERFLDLYAIDVVGLPDTVAQAASLPLIERDPLSAISLVTNDVRRPRAFVAARWRWYADDQAISTALFPRAVGGARGIELSTARLVGAGSDGGPEGPAPARPCVLDRVRPERIELDCPADAAGYAVLLESWDPGWTARVDGRVREIERADLLARAVRFERGERHVTFVYEAPGLGPGLLVSGLALLNLAVLAFVVRRRD